MLVQFWCSISLMRKTLHSLILPSCAFVQSSFLIIFTSVVFGEAFLLATKYMFQKVYRNSHQDGKWQNEEKEGEWPFQKDVQFDVVFVVTPYKVEVSISDFKVFFFGEFFFLCA